MRRFQLAFAAFALAWCAAVPAAAQSARATGVVHDASGHPIRAAIIRAINQDAHPSLVTSTSDDKGRFAMLGLAGGTWTFVVEAPGFVAQRADVPVRVGGTPPLAFVLPRDPGPAPNSLDRNIGQAIADAAALRDQGRYDQAITAYEELRTKNPTLTSIDLVLADTYRRKAEHETDRGAQQKLYDLALATYGDLLKSDASNVRAQAEIDATRTEAARAASGQTR